VNIHTVDDLPKITNTEDSLNAMKLDELEHLYQRDIIEYLIGLESLSD